MLLIQPPAAPTQTCGSSQSFQPTRTAGQHSLAGRGPTNTWLEHMVTRYWNTSDIFGWAEVNMIEDEAYWPLFILWTSAYVFWFFLQQSLQKQIPGGYKYM